jgi:hypothetical protein
VVLLLRNLGGHSTNNAVNRMEVLDLCTGLGRFSQAFRDKDGGYEVTTLYIVHPADIIQDLRTFSTTKYNDVILASPRYTEFSIVEAIPRRRKPDLIIVQACFRIIKEIQPRFWILENPRSCLRHFIGKPACTINYSDFGYYCKKPTDLLGNFPIFLGYIPSREIIPINLGTRNPRKWAQIPFRLSLELCKVMERELNEINASSLIKHSLNNKAETEGFY